MISSGFHWMCTIHGCDDRILPFYRRRVLVSLLIEVIEVIEDTVSSGGLNGIEEGSLSPASKRESKLATKVLVAAH
jgi:hypothetical protein